MTLYFVSRYTGFHSVLTVDVRSVHKDVVRTDGARHEQPSRASNYAHWVTDGTKLRGREKGLRCGSGELRGEANAETGLERAEKGGDGKERLTCPNFARSSAIALQETPSRRRHRPPKNRANAENRAPSPTPIAHRRAPQKESSPDFLLPGPHGGHKGGCDAGVKIKNENVGDADGFRVRGFSAPPNNCWSVNDFHADFRRGATGVSMANCII
ncbi:hypothetical protein B0H14DRAFT_3163446 [Mycena olivaceomarginata]|nr:hypothetical protein B0H14DRAFT_3163446 [Mycena olivaceomarginata]